MNIAQPEALNILSQNYLVEVIGVPLRTKTVEGKDANNENPIEGIKSTTKSRIPGLKINQIRWFHDGKQNHWAKKNNYTKGSAINSLPTESLQIAVVKHSIVMNTMLFTVQH